ncbi:MAG: hypothetical protein ACP5OR_01480 [Candidatus Dormibacteria bacterium]
MSQDVFAIAPITVVPASLCQFKEDNYEFRIPLTTAWLVLLQSSRPMMAANGKSVAPCGYGMNCGGHYMQLAVDATSIRIIAPFAGGVFG